MGLYINMILVTLVTFVVGGLAYTLFSNAREGKYGNELFGAAILIIGACGVWFAFWLQIYAVINL